MIWPGLVAAVVVALVLALVFVPVVGWRPGNRVGGPEDAGTLAGFIFFFVLMAAALWAVSTWMIGPLGITWMPGVWFGIFLIGILLAFMLMLAAPPTRNKDPRTGEPATPASGTSGERAAAGAMLGLGLFFWIVVVLLVAVAIAGALAAAD